MSYYDPREERERTANYATLCFVGCIVLIIAAIVRNSLGLG